LSRYIGRVFDRSPGQHSSFQRSVMEAGETRVDFFYLARRSFFIAFRKV